MTTTFPLPLSFAVALCAATSLPAQQADQLLAARQQALRERGLAAPITLLPVKVLGRPDTNAAEALGLVLERLGLGDLAVSDQAFAIGPDATWEQVPGLLATHVQRLEGTAASRYHLYAEFLGTPRQGPEEVRFVLVDGKGGLVLADRQTPADPDFQRMAARDPDPLGCATLVGDRLFRKAGWKKAPGSIRDGRFAARWRDKSGAPDQQELAAMQSRQQQLRRALADAHVAILPTVAAGRHDVASAERLAELLGKALGCKVTPAVDGSRLQVPASSNEQKRLWDLARALRTAQAQQPVAADYVLAADLGLDPESGRGFAHLALCDRAGQPVIVDFMNDQTPAYKRKAPRRLEDAEQLASERLAGLLR